MRSVIAKGGNRIVSGIDGSAVSLDALEWAARQAKLTDSSLEVVTAWEWPSNFAWSSIPNDFSPEQDAPRLREPILAALRAAHPHVVVT